MSWFSRLSLRAKMLTGFASVLLILASMSVFTYLTVASSERTNQWVEHTHTVIGLANEALASLVNMETGYRGFLVTGNDQFLEPYNAGKAAFAKLIAQLQQGTADNPAQVKRWQDLDARAQAWQKEITEPGIQLRHEVAQGKHAMTDVAAHEGSGKGKVHFDGMRQVLSEAIGAEQTLMESRNKANAQTTTTLLDVTLWGALGACAAGMVIAMLLTNNVNNGIKLTIGRIADTLNKTSGQIHSASSQVATSSQVLA